MTTIPAEGGAWRKARASTANDTCVEVHGTLAALRDSKNPTGPALAVDAAALVTAVKADHLAR